MLMALTGSFKPLPSRMLSPGRASRPLGPLWGPFLWTWRPPIKQFTERFLFWLLSSPRNQQQPAVSLDQPDVWRSFDVIHSESVEPLEFKSCRPLEVRASFIRARHLGRGVANATLGLRLDIVIASTLLQREPQHSGPR